MPDETPVETQSVPTQVIQEYHPPDPPSVWRQNHGNFLIGLMLGICCVGAGVLAYRQSRFVKPSFPDGRLINNEVEEKEQPDDSGGPYLRIAVAGAISSSGNIVLAIYGEDAQDTNLENAIVLDTQPVEFGTAKWQIPLEELPEKFSILAFHDENDDGLLNRKENVTTERYGMSNDMRNDGTIHRALITKPEAGTLLDIIIR